MKVRRPEKNGHTQSVAVLDSETTSGGNGLPQALGQSWRLMDIELLRNPCRRTTPAHSFYLICMLFSTALTPPTLRATWIALVASACEVTEPFSRTVPLTVSTTIPLEFKAG